MRAAKDCRASAPSSQIFFSLPFCLGHPMVLASALSPPHRILRPALHASKSAVFITSPSASRVELRMGGVSRQCQRSEASRRALSVPRSEGQPVGKRRGEPSFIWSCDWPSRACFPLSNTPRVPILSLHLVRPNEAFRHLTSSGRGYYFVVSSARPNLRRSTMKQHAFTRPHMTLKNLIR